jgi:tetratricopeptide (TPR) repeat protein
LELEPRLVVAYFTLTEAYMLSGNGNLAIREGQRALDLGVPGARSVLAAGYLVAGRTAEAIETLKQAVDESRQMSGPFYSVAVAWSVLGDSERAFQYLERAYSDHEPLMVLLNVQPEFDSIRADRRFSDLVRRVGIPSR